MTFGKRWPQRSSEELALPAGFARSLTAAERAEAEATVDAGIALRTALRSDKPIAIVPSKNQSAPPFATPIARGRMPESPYRSELEKDFSALLDARKLAGEIIAYVYEGVTFNLGKSPSGQMVKWRADWMILNADLSITMAETKGHWRRGERERIKLAAGRFPWFCFVAITREDGTWREEKF